MILWHRVAHTQCRNIVVLPLDPLRPILTSLPPPSIPIARFGLGGSPLIWLGTPLLVSPTHWLLPDSMARRLPVGVQHFPW